MNKFLFVIIIALAAFGGISYIDSKMKADQIAALKTDLNAAARANADLNATLNTAEAAYNATIAALNARAERERAAREQTAAILDETLAKLNASGETLDNVLAAFNEINARLYSQSKPRAATRSAANATPARETARETAPQNQPRINPAALPASYGNTGETSWRDISISEDPNEVVKLFQNKDRTGQN